MRSPASTADAESLGGARPGGVGRLTHGIEPVARAAHGDDLEAELAEAAELLAEPAYVDVDCLAVAQIVVAPDLLEEDLAGEDPTWSTHKVGEQLPFLRGQLQLRVVDHRPVSGAVDAQPAEPVLLDLRTHIPLLAASKHGRHPGEKLVQ